MGLALVLELQATTIQRASWATLINSQEQTTLIRGNTRLLPRASEQEMEEQATAVVRKCKSPMETCFEVDFIFVFD